MLYPHIKAGKLRGLTVASERRICLPDLPTSAEQGMPKLFAVNWFAIMAPAKTPRAVVDKLHASLLKAANSPELKERFVGIGVETMTIASPDAFGVFLKKRNSCGGANSPGSRARAPIEAKSGGIWRGAERFRRWEVSAIIRVLQRPWLIWIEYFGYRQKGYGVSNLAGRRQTLEKPPLRWLFNVGCSSEMQNPGEFGNPMSGGHRVGRTPPLAVAPE